MNCSLGSSTLKDLRRHAKTHEKELLKIDTESNGNQPRISIDCDQDGCNASYKSLKSIKRHVKKTHKISVTCDQEECNVKVENMRDLKMHIAVKHEGGIEYICEL